MDANTSKPTVTIIGAGLGGIALVANLRATEIQDILFRATTQVDIGQLG